jgi:hypothetical protein
MMNIGTKINNSTIFLQLAVSQSVFHFSTVDSNSFNCTDTTVFENDAIYIVYDVASCYKLTIRDTISL